MRIIRHIIRTAIVLILLSVIAVAACWIILSHSTAGKTYDNVEDIPYRRVALLLGTSPWRSDGKENRYFTYRIDAAVALYEAGKADYFVVSGDNRHHSYNEPRYMQEALTKRGIPKDIIYCDYAGFRTLDSIVRARNVFGQQSFIVISQKFHNERAIFIGARKGLDIIGLNAKDIPFNIKTKARETFARVKVFLDILTSKQPHFATGDRIDVGV